MAPDMVVIEPIFTIAQQRAFPCQHSPSSIVLLRPAWPGQGGTIHTFVKNGPLRPRGEHATLPPQPGRAVGYLPGAPGGRSAPTRAVLSTAFIKRRRRLPVAGQPSEGSVHRMGRPSARPASRLAPHGPVSDWPGGRGEDYLSVNQLHNDGGIAAPGDLENEAN